MPEPTPPTQSRPKHLLVVIGLVVVLLGFALPQLIGSAPTAPAPAATAPPATAPVRPVETGLGMALVRLVVGLVVVCALCVLVTRWVGRGSQDAAGTMKVLASLPVGRRCVVRLVEAGGRRLLLGTDSAGVKSLVELPGKPEPEPDVPEVSTPVAASTETPVSQQPVVIGPVPAPILTARDEILAMLARTRPGEPGNRGTPG